MYVEQAKQSGVDHRPNIVQYIAMRKHHCGCGKWRFSECGFRLVESVIDERMVATNVNERILHGSKSTTRELNARQRHNL